MITRLRVSVSLIAYFGHFKSKPYFLCWIIFLVSAPLKKKMFESSKAGYVCVYFSVLLHLKNLEL